MAHRGAPPLIEVQDCARASARARAWCAPSTVSAFARRTARSPACSDRTAPARPRPAHALHADAPGRRAASSSTASTRRLHPAAARARLGVLPDARGIYKRLSARENIEYFGRLQGLDDALIAARTEPARRGARHARLHRSPRRRFLARPTHQDRHRARAGARSAQRLARRADQRTRRHDDALIARSSCST